MKKLSYLAMLIAILGFIVLVDCDKQSNNPVQPPALEQDEMISLSKGGHYGPSVHGWGLLTYESGSQRVIRFNAVTLPNGCVKGSGVLTNRDSDHKVQRRIRFIIDCLAVENNVAIISGITIKGLDPNNEPSYWVGRHFQFKVVDNGWGPKADTDEMTHMANWASDEEYLTCEEDVGWETWPIDAGYVMVNL